MARPTDEELLRFIARQEPLTATLEAFPGIRREDLTRLLERTLPVRAEPQASSPTPPVPGAAAGTERLRVYSDGAARGNPGPAGAGAVLTDASGRVLERVGRYLGVQTNNYAEYMGLLLGLERAKARGAREVEVFADSELMVRQLEGRYQVKSPTLRPLYEEARALLRTFARVRVAHVPRAQNAAADEMSNRAIDERL